MNSARVFPAIGIHHRYSSLYPNTGDGHRHKMQGVPARRRCGRKPARKCRSEKGEANAGGRTEFRRALDVTHPRLRVNGSTPGSLARVKPGAGYPVFVCWTILTGTGANHSATRYGI